MSDEITEKGHRETPEVLDYRDDFDVTQLVTSSPVLARLIEEIRNDLVTNHNAYNRMHNRHNRSR